MRTKQSILLFLLIFLNLSLFAQSKDVTLPPNWHHLDLKDGYFGISANRAYQELLQSKLPKAKIVVAVIDGGIETEHEDLKGLLWTNPNEIPGNGIDDDKNGYVDDIHGWNFIGSKKGNLAYDNLESVRIYRKFNSKYKSTINSKSLDSTEKEEFALYRKVASEFGRKYDDAHQNFRVLSIINKMIDSVAARNKKEIPSLDDIKNYQVDDEIENQVKKIVQRGSRQSGGYDKFYKEIKDAYKQYDIMLKYNLNPEYDQRAELVGDRYDDSSQRFYGNNDVMGPNADHGSHVAGIIAANRTNNVGINGIANNVEIMAIRVVPEGDERDKDVANGIRYAVDNGARIINMSFGKGFKWDKKAVDSAVMYAASKNVLIVHAAGNDNENIDRTPNYPTKYYDTLEAIAYEKNHRESLKDLIATAKPQPSMRPGPYGTPVANRTLKKPALDTAKFKLPHAKNWIEVGASAYKNDADLKASFSNYGKYNVDLFAPGFMIKSTVPKSKYEEFDGTSMAAPVVSGVAAVLMSYYPELTAEQVKDILMKSVVKVTQKVKLKDEKGVSSKVWFTELCRSGGIVNLYNAIKLADNEAE